MADETQQPQPQPQQPAPGIGQPVPGAPVIPTPNLDETTEGGAYKRGDVWVNAEGAEIKPPKGKG